MIIRHRGVDCQVGLDPLADPWFWRCQFPQDRAAFWSEVPRHKCLALEGLNAAVVGLLYSRGCGVIVYDAKVTAELLRTAWLTSNTKHDAEMTALQQMSLSSWTDHDLGPLAPAWILEHF